MRLHVVSDVHGSADALARAGDGADALVCLGDLALFLDYADPERGIFADLFGAENAVRLMALRATGDYEAARAFSGGLFATLAPDPAPVLREAVRAQYRGLFAAMPTPAYVTYGNVDLPGLWPEFHRDGVRVLDGERVEIGGLVFGFVGGGLRTRYRTPNEIDDDAFAAKVAAVGAVDVLCSHIPPALPDLTYDVVARRFERGSEALLAAIERTQPRLALFGHVHQPLAARARVGRTECVNVGHFRATGQPYVVRW